MKTKVLVVVDMQEDFLTGSLANPAAVAIIPAIKAKIAKYEAKGGMVFFTRDTHDENYPETQEGRRLPVSHCIRGTSGWEIVKDLYPITNAYYTIGKETFGSVNIVPEIQKTLETNGRSLGSIEFCGTCTDICVVSNVLIAKAQLPEITVTVDAACCAGLSAETNYAALLTMRACQVDILNMLDNVRFA